MEYKPTNLPAYWTITPRTSFSSAVIQEGHVLLFSQDGQSLTAKKSDGSYKVIGSDSSAPTGADVTLGVVDSQGRFQALKFNGTEASNSGSAIQVQNYKTWNSTLPAPQPSGGSMELYKCASVDTANHTWTGYKAVFDAATGTYSFESTVTSGLTYGSGFTPRVGEIYTDGVLVQVTKLYSGLDPSLVLYVPLSSSALTADTGQAITTASGVTFTTEDSIPCARLIDSAVNFEIAPTDVPTGSDPRTICIWVKRDSQYTGTQANIIQYGTAGQNNQVAIGYSGGKMCVDLFFNQNLGSVTVDQTQWNFIAVTMANSAVKVYLNGVLHMTFNSSFNTGSPQYVNIGQNESGEWPFGSGYAAGLRIYDRELSADEIAELASEFMPIES